MACTATPAEVYAELECYGVSSANISTTWIERRRDKFIKPFLRKRTRLPLEGSETILSEVHSGTGEQILTLNRRFVSSVERIKILTSNTVNTVDIGSIQILSREGILKSMMSYESATSYPMFPKGKNNLLVDYTVTVPPDAEADICEAIIYLLCEKVLGQLASRTGGGNLSVQGFSRDFGPRGRWSHVRNDFARDAAALLKPYMTGVVGQ